MKYDAICMDCTHTYEFYSKIDERDNVPACPACAGGDVRRVILNAPQACVTGKFNAFVSQVDGTLVRNNKELAEHNKRNNVFLLGEAYSNEDILAGRCAPKKVEPDKKDIQKDIVESIRKCEAGYKPVIQQEGAEL